MDERSPLLQALPPATDHMTYLTILGYNVNHGNMTLLHEILQDTELTSSIGWDLVEMLLPLLPTSKECLKMVASAGNPREVLLKVTEAVRCIDFERDEDDESIDAADTAATSTRAETASIPHRSSAVEELAVLLEMLITLHARIKTKAPSRFLATSLDAIIDALASADRSAAACAVHALHFAETILGSQQPPLPSRRGAPDGLAAREQEHQHAPPASSDPEAQNISDPAGEKSAQRALLGDFTLRLFATYCSSLDAPDVPALQWTSRQQERVRPGRNVPGRRTVTAGFGETPALAERDVVVKRFCKLGDMLGLRFAELWAAALGRTPPDVLDLEEVRSSRAAASSPSSDLTPVGALLLLAANHSLDPTYPTHSTAELRPFPQHHRLLTTFIGAAASGGPPSAGTESPSVIDAVLCLGHAALHNASGIIDLSPPTLHALRPAAAADDDDDDDQNVAGGYATFFAHLQLLTVLSATSPSPSLRYHAHVLASETLHAHPSPAARLRFIEGTLRQCPLDSLRASAVEWFKTEVLAASVPETGAGAGLADGDGVFALPETLERVADALFPSLEHLVPAAAEEPHTTPSPSEAYASLHPSLPVHLSSLALAYLLLTSPSLARLHFGTSLGTRDVRRRFAAPLRRLVDALGEPGRWSGSLREEGRGDGR